MVATTSRHPTGWTFEWSVAVLQDGRPMMVHEAQTQWQRFNVFLGMGWKQLLGGSSQDLVQWLLTMVIVVVTVNIGLFDSKCPNFMTYFHGSDPHHVSDTSPGSPSNPSTNPLGESPSSVGERWAFGAYLSGFGACLGATPSYGFYQSHLSQRSPVSVLMSFKADFPANVLPGTRTRSETSCYFCVVSYTLSARWFSAESKGSNQEVESVRLGMDFLSLKNESSVFWLALSREWGNEALHGYKEDSFPHSLLRASQFFICDFIIFYLLHLLQFLVKLGMGDIHLANIEDDDDTRGQGIAKWWLSWDIWSIRIYMYATWNRKTYGYSYFLMSTNCCSLDFLKHQQ